MTLQKVVWIDDAADYMFQPIRRMLMRRKYDVHVCSSYESARREFERFNAIHKQNLNSFPPVIVDLLIPRSEQKGALNSNELGFTLAREASRSGASKVMVFTVVSKSRVSVEFAQLKSDHKNTHFFFLEKTRFGPLGILETLTYFLNHDSQGGSEEFHNER